ncbi:MAG: heme-binding protein [Polaribacter sp.]|uniref:SOUL family heme-binding protein n=1 Tax=Polaribacter sp. TaxID=1920175 RepID=UPI0026266CF4|nr:heme-binding protein [Polaribacter sp.]MDG1194732.1 heme-binding protein [Polaribacter sp.]MDG1403100.1 heme-binding protein [Polaribacter sp.]
MKILLTIFGVILLIFIIVQLFAINGQKNIETYSYDVAKKYDAFEIRNYEASLFTYVKLSGNKYRDESSKGFSILAGYIFGGNDKNEKIAMTSPVAMSLEDSMTMMFMVPKKFKKETLPKPDQSEIKFQEEPKKTVAAIAFSGWANDEKIEKYKQKLKSALEAKEIPYTNRFFFLGYNPPYEIFNRKNEIIVELKREAIN